MCGSFFKKVIDPMGLFKRLDDPVEPPAPVAAPAAVDERAVAEDKAAAASNAKAAELSKQRKQGSLLAAGGGAGGQAQTSSVLAYGKNRLGE